MRGEAGKASLPAGQKLLADFRDKGLTFVALANSDGLTNRYNLAGGDVLLSPVAAEFVRAFVTKAWRRKPSLVRQ